MAPRVNRDLLANSPCFFAINVTENSVELVVLSAPRKDFSGPLWHKVSKTAAFVIVYTQHLLDDMVHVTEQRSGWGQQTYFVIQIKFRQLLDASRCMLGDAEHFGSTTRERAGRGAWTILPDIGQLPRGAAQNLPELGTASARRWKSPESAQLRLEQSFGASAGDVLGAELGVLLYMYLACGWGGRVLGWALPGQKALVPRHFQL
ncbi:hypothetical protein Bbelb_355830 [Branchiostoma belcheri]|nr:hypothetical protein Bbelb_438550 [Branchiostoma belcheri]KAI8486608.1 hypothetical protein Bbelb_355830 [Branchiostoma belcheri]